MTLAGWTCVNHGRMNKQTVNQTVSIVRAAVFLVLLGEASLPARRPRSHVGARVGLEFVNVLGKFTQHARA